MFSFIEEIAGQIFKLTEAIVIEAEMVIEKTMMIQMFAEVNIERLKIAKMLIKILDFKFPIVGKISDVEIKRGISARIEDMTIEKMKDEKFVKKEIEKEFVRVKEIST